MSKVRVQDLYTGRVASLWRCDINDDGRRRTRIAAALSIDLARNAVHVYTDRRRFLTDFSAVADEETRYVVRGMSSSRSRTGAPGTFYEKRTDARVAQQAAAPDPYVASVKPVAEERALRFAKGISDRDQRLAVERKSAPIAFG